MRLGIFGGTFDPIHNGHLIVAEHVREELVLARVLFIPAGRPWFKAEQDLTDAEHRLEMVRLATADYRDFEVSEMEIRREGPTYTIDTLMALREEKGGGVEYFLILGIDALNELHRWRRPRDVLDLATVVGVGRAGVATVDRTALESIREGASDEVVIVDGPFVDISAAAVRRRMAGGLSVEGLIPWAVKDYVTGHGLYRRKECV